MTAATSKPLALTTTTGARRYTIKEASQLSGNTMSEIRIWQVRYRWPNPDRLPNGYRVFTNADIENLQHAKQMREAGFSISQLVRDGLYVGREVAGGDAPVRPSFVVAPEDLVVLPSDLPQALARKHVAVVASYLAQLPIYRSEMRDAIIRSVEAADRFHGGCFRPVLDHFLTVITRSA